jgi:glycerophosphoryl diester phosphodiesterase
MARGRERIGSTGSVTTVAHRGEPVGHRENTLPAILAGLRAGADMVEIDVKTTADDEVVLLHDDTLDRLWEVPAAIRETTSAQLAHVTGPVSGVAGGIPTLTEGLAAIHRTGAALMIDMDAPDLAEPALAVVRASLHAGWLAPDEVVWCGHLEALRTIREQDPSARIVLSWGGPDLPDAAVVAELAPEAVNPMHPLVTDSTVDWAAGQGVSVCCWTVDDPVRMRELQRLGVAAIISNRIALLIQTVGTAPG